MWEFDHASGMTAAAYAVHPEEKSADGLVIMPRLVFGKVNCNCTKFPHLGDITVSSQDETETVSQNLDLGSKSNGEEDVSESEEQELSSGDSDDTDAGNVELFTETMNLKGSNYHSSFQSHLRQWKEALMKKETVSVRLHFKPTNRHDENAIVVQVKLGQGQKSCGSPLDIFLVQKCPKRQLYCGLMKFNWSLLKMFFVSMFHPSMILGSFHQLLFQRWVGGPEQKKTTNTMTAFSCWNMRGSCIYNYNATLQTFVK